MRLGPGGRGRRLKPLFPAPVPAWRPAAFGWKPTSRSLAPPPLLSNRVCADAKTLAGCPLTDDADHLDTDPWDAVIAKLPSYLEALLASPIYGRGKGRAAAPKEHGVYLFTEEGQHLYVGRCGLTERAKKVGKGHSNFRTRLAGHSCPSSTHNQATFAWRLTFEKLGSAVDSMPSTRAELQLHPAFRDEFLCQKVRVTAMQFRVLAIEDDFESYVFEAYAARQLKTPHNSWATS